MDGWDEVELGAAGRVCSMSVRPAEEVEVLVSVGGGGGEEVCASAARCVRRVPATGSAGRPVGCAVPHAGYFPVVDASGSSVTPT